MSRVGFRPRSWNHPTTATPYIGAIRWDAWFGPSTFPAAVNAGDSVELNLGPNTYRYRLPFFGTEVNATTVTVRGNAQATVDQEIAYARQAGLHYWAFLTYQPPDHPTLDHLTYGLKLYRSSTAKQGLRYCHILHQLGLMADWAAVTVPQYVAMAAEADYMKVLGNRPLFFLFAPVFTGNAVDASHITTLRNACTAAGLANPYIVAMGGASTAATEATALGCDAISGYTWSGTNGGTGADNQTYAQLVAANSSQKTQALATGKQIIPCVNEGWDKRPRFDVPAGQFGVSPNIWYTRATAAEFANNVRDTVDWVRLNRAQCEAQTIIIYAWNEIDEGGWMTPPHPSHGAEGTTRLDGLKIALLNRRILA